MDKVIKLNSKEGGPFSATSNLINFDIMPNGVYDFTDSYVNLVCSIDGVADADATTGVGVYNPVVNFGAVDGIRSVYNVALVKNCSMTSELQGALEDIRRVDILRQNLNEYTLTTDQKQSLEYQSLRQLTKGNFIRSSTFNELHNEGAVASRAVQSRLQIPMGQLFELGKLAQFPANKLGKIRVALEMNLGKFFIAKNSMKNSQAGYGIFPNIDGQATPVDIRSLESTASYVDKENSPYYVGMKVKIKFKTDVAGAEAVGTIAIGTNRNATLDGAVNTNLQHGGAQKVKLVGAVGNTSNYTIVGTDINNLPITETAALTADTPIVSTKLYRTITSIAVDANVANTAVTITTNGDAGGANSLVAERIITNIAYSKTTNKQTLTFDRSLAASFPNGKTLTLEDQAITSGETSPTQNVKVLPIDPNVTNAKFKINTAELVLRQLGAPPKAPSQLNYMSWSTEEFNGNDQANFQKMFQLEPAAINVFMMFPTADLFSVNTNLNSYRLRLGGPSGNEDLTNRDVVPRDPLYYDRLSMAMLNGGLPTNSVREQNMNVSVAETGTDITREDDGGNLLIVANPVPATSYEKLLQVNMSLAGGTGNGLNELVLFKQVMRGVSL